MLKAVRIVSMELRYSILNRLFGNKIWTELLRQQLSAFCTFVINNKAKNLLPFNFGRKSLKLYYFSGKLVFLLSLEACRGVEKAILSDYY